MNRVTFPLKRNTQGEAVANLQDGLRIFLERKVYQVSDTERKVLLDRLASERMERTYGESTHKLIDLFQRLRQFQPTGDVDERTARALNDLLDEFGVFDLESPKQRTVAGRIQRENKSFLAGAPVRAFHTDSNVTVRLGEDTTDAEGRYTIRYAPLPGANAINLRVAVIGADDKPLRVTPVIPQAKPLEVVDLVVPNANRRPFLVVGKVASRVSASVDGLVVRIVDKGVGEDFELTTASTDANGEYQASFTEADLAQRDKTQPDLQARVFAGDKFLAASQVRYRAPTRVRLNVTLTEKATPTLRSEHETLTKSLSSHFRGKLAELKETDELQDITYLANKSGWDARAVALASLAEQYSARTKVAGAEIASPFFYALFRAGVSAHDSAVYQIDAPTRKGLWNQAIAEGVISAKLESSLADAAEKFNKLTAEHLLDSPASIGVSSFTQLLRVSLGEDADPVRQRAKEAKFAEIHARFGADPTEFWKAVRDGFGAQLERRVKLDGQLAYLTLNNAPLMRKLHAEAGTDGLADSLGLIATGYYQSAKWRGIIGNDVIPKEIPGADEAEKLTRYTELLAAQLRFSFRTAVVAQMVKSRETPLVGNKVDAVNTFLNQHHEKLEIGLHPVEQYVKRNNLQIDPEVSREITRIQRTYQITPTNEAMNVLLKKDIDSAYKVVRYDRDEFVRTFKKEVGGELDARLIHAKAQEVHNAVVNIAVSYLTARSAPGIGVHSPAQIINPAPQGPNPNASDVIAYPTLESLFGAMDYCHCAHCRSILSPAAYLVDLLLFCDRPVNEKENPQTVLLSRRPDIQHLPLTCENTNTPLPYIDVVNETLEYYITNNLSLANYKGHDTDASVAAEELSANPQFVSEIAQDILAGRPVSGFPSLPQPPRSPLPFHHSLESLRRYFDKFEAPLPQVMEALRTSNNLERATASDYGWRDILMEELKLSRTEYAKLSESAVTAGNTNVMLTLKQLSGYPAGTSDAEVMATLSNAKAFSRRLGITYEQLIEVLKTRFINPNATLIPKVEKLGVTFDTLKKLKTGSISDQDFDKALAPHLDPRQYGDDIKAWVRNDANYTRLMSLITLAVPITRWAGSTAYRSGDCVVPTAPGGSTLLYECTTPGTSGTTEPTSWPTASGKTQADGTVVWTCRFDLSDCSFDRLRFRYADPDKIAQNLLASEFIRLLRFIRLWKKLGWTIEQIDKALAALFPTTANQADDALNLQNLDAGFKSFVPRLGIVNRLMQESKLTVKKDLLPLLACFAPIDTTGLNSLYRQLFLSPSLLRPDQAFADDGYGNFLSKVSVTYTHTQPTLTAAILAAGQNRIAYDHAGKVLSYFGVLDIATRNALKVVAGVSDAFRTAVDALFTQQRLRSHSESLRSAFNLTDEEFTRVLNVVGVEAPLTLENISAIHRHGWLARKLKLSVREFIALLKVTGLDPFVSPDPVDPAILRLLELVSSLRCANLNAAQALYWVWNHDVGGRSIPDETQLLDCTRSLRLSFAAIESEFALVDDPEGKIARERMSLVYGNEATDLFFSLLDRTLTTEVPHSRAAAPVTVVATYQHSAATLPPEILTPAAGQLTYDHAATRLTWNGVLTTALRETLKAVPGVSVQFQTAMDQLYLENQLVLQANLPQAIVDLAPGRISYDDFRKRLCWNGVLTTTWKDAIKLGQTPEFQTAVDELFAENQKVVKSFADRYPELVPLHEAFDFFGELSSFANYTHGQPTLEATILDAAAGRLAYDPNLKTLSYSGVLSSTRRDTLKNLPGMSAAFVTAIDNLFNTNQQAIQDFWTRFPTLAPTQPQKDVYLSADNALDRRRSALLAAFLPPLKERRKRQLALQGVSSLAKTDVSFANELVDNRFASTPPKYVLYADGDPLRPAVDDLIALGKAGFSAQFFYRDTATGNVDLTRDAEAHLEYATTANTLPANPVAGNAISGIWSGYLEAPENGFYKLEIQAEAGATVAVSVNAESVALAASGSVWNNVTPIELRAGTLYFCSIKVEKIKQTMSVRWETTGRGREVLPAPLLYSLTLVDHLRAIYLRFLKATSLATALKLSIGEMKYFAAHADYLIGAQGWLNSLPVTSNPNAATAQLLLKALKALLDFARIKADLSPDDEAVLEVLKNPEATIPNRVDVNNNPESKLLALTGWEAASLDALLIRFGKVQGQQADRRALKELRTFVRVCDAYAWLEMLKVPASVFIQSVTNEPTNAVVNSLQSALRARYERGDWLTAVKPINDEMRALRRDALVAFILHQMSLDPNARHIDTTEKLFEYFLMDVQMEPITQTSRIRHALSSVQLFIERCLMNLEARVSSASINAKHWDWMRRYRVWEANRKVFLWPENWLEWELRDDQSPFFKEAMSELLQGDITEDRAAVALLNYLSNLGEVAHLEPCGVFHVENDPGKADDIAHVVARTTGGANRKYFYRRRDGGSWTPWEQIKLEIEDTPIIPVVWRDRLFLFWLKVLQQGLLDSNDMTSSGATTNSEGKEETLEDCKISDIKQSAKNDGAENTKSTVQLVLCYSEYYNDKWQPMRTSDVNNAAILGTIVPGTLNRAKWKMSVYEEETSLVVRINGLKSVAFKLYNAFTEPIPYKYQTPDSVEDSYRFDVGTTSNKVSIKYRIGNSSKTRDVLQNLRNLKDRVIEPHQYDLENGLLASFFYFDANHVFYVSQNKRIVKIPDKTGFGPPSRKPPSKFPPLVLEPVKPIPDPAGPVILDPDFGVIDPSPFERFVTEDIDIQRAIGATGTVRFNGKEIGPKGGMPPAQRQG